MNPHAYSETDSSFSPPPLGLKSLPYLPSTPAEPSAPKPLNTKSPVRRKPLPSSAFSPPLTATTLSEYGGTGSSLDQNIEPLTAVRTNSGSPLVIRDLDQFPHGLTPVLSDTSAPPRLAKHAFRDPKPLPLPPEEHTTQAESPPQIAVAFSLGNVDEDKSVTHNNMALKPAARPPPLRMDSSSSAKSLSANDAKKPQTPGGKVSSFFGWKRNVSPSIDSLSTESSDNGRSPGPSPIPGSPQTSGYSSRTLPGSADTAKAPHSPPKQDFTGFGGPLHISSSQDDMAIKVSQLENELREISSELAGSIRREMDLEDLVEKLQLEASSSAPVVDRTSDYFSDSGNSLFRPPGSDAGYRDDLDRIKRDMEQQRAQVRVDLSQKWQDERNRRKALESHVQILEEQITHSRRNDSESSDLAAKTRELENALEDARRRLTQERQTKENLEDLLTGFRVELEQHRNQRDNLRDEVVPQLRSQIEGLETTLSDSQKQSYDLARMQQEIKTLKAENASLMQRNGLGINGINSISEEESPLSPTNFGLTRSNTAAGLSHSNTIRGLNRSGSLSRSNTQTESPESLPDKLKAVELQRDALHTAVRYLLQRQDHQARQVEKKLRVLEMERDRAISNASPQRVGYEKDVKGLRGEINLLRKRADDALEQKWQCEKGLGGLKMDLDRSKQETASLRNLLQERDSSVPNSMLSSLEQAYSQLQTERNGVKLQQGTGPLISIEEEPGLADQVKDQVHANSSLRNRLKEAVARGEENQAASAAQISELEIKLRKLEDVITAAQTQSETAVMKHEEEIRVIRASHNAQLLRAKAGIKTPGLLSPTPRSPLSPLFANSKRSPKLHQTSTGPGIALHQALKTEYLEHKVAELEKALSDAEKEMGEVVGRMNTAQIGVAELQSERDEALRQTRRLEATIAAERERVHSMVRR